MGNYSWLRATRNTPEQCLIQWELFQEKSVCNLILQDLLAMPFEERPNTLQEMAERWNDTKFVGYFTKEYITYLQQFCKILTPYGSNPRLFYEYEGMEQIWCIEFIPGTDIINIGIYDYNSMMNSCRTVLPRYPKYNSELCSEWEQMYKSVVQYLQKQCIDNYSWNFRRLEYIEVKEEQEWTILLKR